MTAAPISFSPSQGFHGNDGPWSTFAVRIGTPPQTFHVLPSTSSSETWIPLPDGCIEDDPSDCAQTRGAFNGLFRTNVSSTWKDLGIYNLHLEIHEELGLSGNAAYGIDTVGLQVAESGGVQLDTQVVGGIATKDFYLGVFGLGVKPVNFTTLDHPIPSFVQSLKDKNMIPSLSWAYTAGAAYRRPKVFGSLTLGGLDKSRFDTQAQSTTYPFDPDDSMPLSIFIESITASDSLEGRATLLDNSKNVYATIDTTIPHIWLPEEACDRFAEVFGLQHDPTTDLYRINATTRNKLLSLNPSITIGLGSNTDPLNRTSISIPYAAFDLQASYPIYPDATYYFPLRRAVNASQYRLGRVFLQEAYLVADYERRQFSIHQATFKSPMPEPELEPILSPLIRTNSTETPKSTSSGSLSTGAKAGIGVGVCLALICFGIIIFFVLRSRRRQAKEWEDNGMSKQLDAHGKPQGPIVELPDNERPLELHSAVKYELHERPDVTGEGRGWATHHELNSAPTYEMYEPPRELGDGTTHHELHSAPTYEMYEPPRELGEGIRSPVAGP